MSSSSPDVAPDLAFEDSAELYAAFGSQETAVLQAAYHTVWAYLYRVAHYMAKEQPDQEAFAQDCAQKALIRIHERWTECEEPKAFRSWCRRIVSNLLIDELRRRKRFGTAPLDKLDEKGSGAKTAVSSAETIVVSNLNEQSLRQLLDEAPISDRSRRVVVGRYLDDVADEQLAQQETELSQKEVRPSHIQVTRAKNLTKLRHWPKLQLDTET